MKRFVLRGILLLGAMSLLTGCASTEDVGRSSTQSSSTPVPGEKTSDQAVSATAGPGTAGAGVRW